MRMREKYNKKRNINGGKGKHKRKERKSCVKASKVLERTSENANDPLGTPPIAVRIGKETGARHASREASGASNASRCTVRERRFWNEVLEIARGRG